MIQDGPHVRFDPALMARDEALMAQIQGIADGTVPVAGARDASTVLLLRDGPSGLQTYLLRRHETMVFGGAYVFPGGSLDPEDGDASVPWAGPDVDWWAQQFDCPPAQARSLVCAAVRETFEECGVLLAGPDADSVLADVSTDDWEAERVAVERHEQSLAGLLTRRGLVLRSDLLRPFTHWITPDDQPRRFDTRFFLAALPGGQLGRLAGAEADLGVWVDPPADDLRLISPTVACLQELATFPDVATALSRPWTPHTVRVNWELTDAGPVLMQRVSVR